VFRALVLMVAGIPSQSFCSGGGKLAFRQKHPACEHFQVLGDGGEVELVASTG